MAILWVVFLASGVLAWGGNQSRPFLVDEEDALMTVPQLIRKYGYEVEEHQVRTEDGYLLGMFRIPTRSTPRKQPVFMMHSLFSSCADWVLIGPKHGLAYLLAERGYDIWIGNARGTRYSRKHERISVNDPQFWDFTFHEIGFYDVPALVDYVLERTRARKVHYIGFSQGAMTVFIAFSQRPEVNEKIVQVQALSPAVYMNRSQSSVIRLLVSAAHKIAEALTAIGKYEILPHWEKQYYFFQRLCPAPAQLLCRLLIYNVVGANPEQLDVKMLRIFLGHFPAGASRKQILHYAQIIRDGIFRQYDYGDPVANRQAYGSSVVPLYNLSRAVAPVRTYFGYNDNVINYLNVLQLNRELPNLVGSYPVSDKRFSHIDFILANNVREVLYAEVVKNVGIAEREFVLSLET
ncbi:lipase 1-like [Toxorhynchites rutilus septentrionalis]|uniref:lipase 1-like n=1 Tax=Toxorhynchites rutilus septentrionalis TaxID=329112 RepID=UPI00247A1FAE|nr:lipase 1-like [Toxorhynchites rutilus septentrionalis]